MPAIEQLSQYEEEESLADGQGVKYGARHFDVSRKTPESRRSLVPASDIRLRNHIAAFQLRHVNLLRRKYLIR
jgi:hypothetical protein